MEMMLIRQTAVVSVGYRSAMKSNFQFRPLTLNKTLTCLYLST